MLHMVSGQSNQVGLIGRKLDFHAQNPRKGSMAMQQPHCH
jgi:hypothetical protein